MNLEEIRKKINKIDDGILKLLFERMEIMSEVADYKTKNNLPIFDAEREKEILKKMKQLAKEKKLSINFIQKIYQEIMDEGKRRQEKIL